jgi:hypothetical protein
MKAVRLSVISVIIWIMMCVPLFSMAQSDSLKQNWVNLAYAKCLTNQLPCMCEKIAGIYFSATLDTNQNSNSYGVSFMGYRIMEAEDCSIRKVSANTFGIHSKGSDSIPAYGTLRLKGDTLYIDQDNSESTFVRYHIPARNISDPYQKENIILLDEALKRRKYPALEDLLKEDSLSCDCNNWMGQVNLISAMGEDRGKSWILELRSGNLLIYYISNISNRPENPDDRVERKLIKKYKWRPLKD